MATGVATWMDAGVDGEMDTGMDGGMKSHRPDSGAPEAQEVVTTCSHPSPPPGRRPFPHL